MYDKEALKQLAAAGKPRNGGQELTCTGASCFKMSFIIITAATIFGAIISLILVARTIQFYKGDIYKRYRDQAEETATTTTATTTTAGAEMKVVQSGGERRQEAVVG